MNDSLFTKKTVAIIVVAVFALSAIIYFVGGKFSSSTTDVQTPQQSSEETVEVKGASRQDPIGALSPKGEPSVKEKADRLKVSKNFEQMEYPQAPFMVEDKFFSESEEGEKGWGLTQEKLREQLNANHSIEDAQDLFVFPEAYERSSAIEITDDLDEALQFIGVSPYATLVAYPMGDNILYVRYVFAPQSQDDTTTWKVDLIEVAQ